MKERLNIRRTILVPIRNRSAFLELYFSDPGAGGIGGVLVPTTTKLSVGDRCELELAFAAENIVVHCRGIARWRRMSAQKNLPAGTGVELDPNERRTRDLLLDFASGKDVPLIKRSARRFPVEIQIDYRGGSVQGSTLTEDISLTGCFLRTPTLPALGGTLDLKLRPPGFMLGIALQAEVVWQRRNDPQGVGLRFVEPARGSRKRLEELLDRVKQQALDEAER
jgi:Tfp pilus assembly protein PilZ